MDNTEKVRPQASPEELPSSAVGLMGSGIAAVLMLHGPAFTLVESTAELLEQGVERLRRLIGKEPRYGALLAEGFPKRLHASHRPPIWACSETLNL